MGRQTPAHRGGMGEGGARAQRQSLSVGQRSASLRQQSHAHRGLHQHRARGDEGRGPDGPGQELLRGLRDGRQRERVDGHHRARQHHRLGEGSGDSRREFSHQLGAAGAVDVSHHPLPGRVSRLLARVPLRQRHTAGRRGGASDGQIGVRPAGALAARPCVPRPVRAHSVASAPAFAYPGRVMPRRGSNSSEEASPKARVTRESMREMLSLYTYLRPYRAQLFTGLVMLLASTALGVFFPYLSALMINSKTHTQALHLALLTVLILFVQATMSYFQSLLFNTAGEYGLSDLRKALFAHLTEMPMTFYAQRQVGELTSRMMADLTQLQDAFVMAIPQCLRQTMIILSSIAMMIFISPQLTGVMVACFPPTIIGAILIGRMVGGRARNTQQFLANAANVIEETLQGIANVKAYGNEAFEQRRYDSRLVIFLQSILHGARARASLVAFIIFAIFTAIVIVLWYGTTLLIDHRLNAGKLFGFTLYTIFVGGAI